MNYSASGCCLFYRINAFHSCGDYPLRPTQIQRLRRFLLLVRLF